MSLPVNKIPEKSAFEARGFVVHAAGFGEAEVESLRAECDRLLGESPERGGVLGMAPGEQGPGLISAEYFPAVARLRDEVSLEQGEQEAQAVLARTAELDRTGTVSEDTLGRGLLLVLVGPGTGTAASLAASRALAHLLFGIDHRDRPPDVHPGRPPAPGRGCGGRVGACVAGEERGAHGGTAFRVGAWPRRLCDRLGEWGGSGGGRALPASGR